MLLPRTLLDTLLLLRGLVLLSVLVVLRLLLPLLSLPLLLSLVLLFLLLGMLIVLVLLFLLLSMLPVLVLLFLLLGMLPVLVLRFLLLSMLLVLVLLFLLLSVLLVLVLLFLLLSVLLLLILVLLLLLFSVLLVLVPLLLFLGMLRLGLSFLFGFALLLSGMVLFFVLLFLPRIGGDCDPQEQRHDRSAGDSIDLHKCCLHFSVTGGLSFYRLPQASRGRIDWLADGFARYEELHSPVLLPASRIVVGGNRQGVSETLCAYRIGGDALLYQVVSYRSRSVFRQLLIHLVAAHIVRVAADFNVESGVSEQNAGDLCQLLAGSGLQ